MIVSSYNAECHRPQQQKGAPSGAPFPFEDFKASSMSLDLCLHKHYKVSEDKSKPHSVK